MKNKYIENLNKFKKDFLKKEIDIKFEELNKYFYIENYFLSNKIVYFDEKFNEILFQIISTSLKNYTANLDYYINVRNTNIITEIESKIINNDKEILKQYLEFNILIKKLNLIYLEHKINSNEELNKFLENALEISKKYFKLSSEKENQIIKEINLKLKEIKNEKNNEEKLISSMYN